MLDDTLSNDRKFIRRTGNSAPSWFRSEIFIYLFRLIECNKLEHWRLHQVCTIVVFFVALNWKMSMHFCDVILYARNSRFDRYKWWATIKMMREVSNECLEYQRTVIDDFDLCTIFKWKLVRNSQCRERPITWIMRQSSRKVKRSS